MSRSWEWPNRSVNSFRDSVLRVIRRCLEEFVKGPSFFDVGNVTRGVRS